MAEKKEQFKFTIQFNAADPAHQQTAAVLNQQGRRKAQFIVNAIQHYIHCKETPTIPQAAPVDTGALEAIIRKILVERSAPQAALEKPSVMRRDMPGEIRLEEAADGLDTEGIAAIADAMAHFRGG